MVTSILVQIMRSLLLFSEVYFIFVYLLYLLHPKSFLLMLTQIYPTQRSVLCFAFLRPDVSHASLFCVITHEIFEALMSCNLPYMICLPDDSSSYLPSIQKFLISQDDTQKQTEGILPFQTLREPTMPFL